MKENSVEEEQPPISTKENMQKIVDDLLDEKGEIRKMKILLNEKGEVVLDADGNVVYAYEDTGEEVKMKIDKDEFIEEMENEFLRELDLIDRKLSDEEVLEYVEDKRNKFFLYLIEVISEERVKEEKREEVFVNCFDIEEKKKIQNSISFERALSEKKVKKINE